MDVAGRAHYLRIASDIRDRISGGDLGPGDRVPSTRAIMRDWGVAMATATKVIAILKSEGLISTRPGYGSVVLPTSATRPLGLDLDRIVTTAIHLADNEGLPSLTMRRVAVELDVATMSLYRHVSGKDALVEAMVDRVLREHSLPRTTGHSWRADLEAIARSMWSTCHRHPWVASSISLTRPQLVPSLLLYADRTLAVLRPLTGDVDAAMNAHLTLFAYIRSAASGLEAEAAAFRDTGMTNEEWLNSRDRAVNAVVATGRYPAFAWVVREGYDYDTAALFTFGLRSLLDGFAVGLATCAADHGPPSRELREHP